MKSLLATYILCILSSTLAHQSARSNIEQLNAGTPGRDVPTVDSTSSKIRLRSSRVQAAGVNISSLQGRNATIGATVPKALDTRILPDANKTNPHNIQGRAHGASHLNKSASLNKVHAKNEKTLEDLHQPTNVGARTWTECTQDPAYFGGSCRIYGPPVGTVVLGSLILLGPWNSAPDGMYDWVLEPEWACNEMKDNGCTLDPLQLTKVQQIKANLRIVTLAGRRLDGVEHSWYHYEHWNSAIPNPQDLDAAVAYVHHVIMQEVAVVGDYKRVALIGLSQGADLALESATRFPAHLGMVISERGALPPQRRVTAGLVTPGTPFILSAGEWDHYYPTSISNQCCVSLRQTATPVYMRIFSGLDHDSWSLREWELSIELASLMLQPDHPTPLAVRISSMPGHAGQWTPCDLSAICFDREDFRDQWNYACSDWAGGDCTTANPDHGYSKTGESCILQNCRKSCGLCL